MREHVSYRRNYFIFSLLAALMIVMLASPRVCAANPSLVSLKAGQTYTYDATGNRKNNTIRYTLSGTNNSWYRHKNAVIYIDGKKAWSLTDYTKSGVYSLEVSLITLANKKVFFWIAGEIDNGDDPIAGIFQYKNGKLKKVVNLNTPLKKFGNHLSFDILSVKKNTITVKNSSMSYALSYLAAAFTYTWKGGKLQLNKTGTVLATRLTFLKSKYFTVNKKIPVYKKAGGSAKAFTLNKNQKVSVSKIYTTGKNMYLKIKTSKGKTGWIKSPTKGVHPTLFKEVMYAG